MVTGGAKKRNPNPFQCCKPRQQEDTLENRREEEKIVLDGQREKESHESRGERD